MTGSHQRSLHMLLDEDTDGSVIASTFLEDEIVRRPDFQHKSRIIDTIGPSPAPLFLMNNTLSRETQERIREVFWRMPTDARGQRILRHANLSHFVLVEDDHYDRLCEMTEISRKVSFPPPKPHQRTLK